MIKGVLLAALLGCAAAAEIAHKREDNTYGLPTKGANDLTHWMDPDGFSVQTGYEGYLVPDEPEDGSGPSPLALLKALGALSAFTPFPKLGLKLALKLGSIAVSFLSFLFVGAAFTSAVCALTPLCTISFLGFRFDSSSARSLITQDRLDGAAKFVMNAINKYKTLNKAVKKA